MAVYRPDIQWEMSWEGSEIALRRRNPCRRIVDGVVDWEGLSTFTSKSGSDETSRLQFSLSGKYTRELILGERVMDFGGDDTSALADHFTEISGIPFNGGSDNPIGLVYYKGSWLVWLDNFGRYDGGWCLENRLGDWQHFR